MATRETGTLWIFKLDGTIQCAADVPEVTLDAMRAELETRIGSGNVLGMEKRSIMMIELCGMPTGRANAYLVTSKGWDLLTNGTVGNPGFAPWPEREHSLSTGSAEVPVILLGIVSRIEVDYCQDGARFQLHSASQTARLLPTNKEAADFLERVAGSRQRVSVAGYPRQSAECHYLAVYYAGSPERVLDTIGAR